MKITTSKLQSMLKLCKTMYYELAVTQK